jgi:hypothetical protein
MQQSVAKEKQWPKKLGHLLIKAYTVVGRYAVEAFYCRTGHREKHRRLERLTGLTREFQHPPQQTNATVSAFKEQFTLRAYKFSVRASNSSTKEILRKRNLI